MKRKRENATRSYSIGVSERDLLEEHAEDADEGEGPVIFQQCGAQNFNGHRECAKRGARNDGDGF